MMFVHHLLKFENFVENWWSNNFSKLTHFDHIFNLTIVHCIALATARHG